LARKPAEQTVTREAILLAAANVLNARGYYRTKMEDIAREVALTAGSLYHHFPEGKQEILIAVLSEGLDSISQQIEAILASEQAASAKLRQAVRLHVVSITTHVSIGAAMVYEIRTLLDIPEIREVYVQRRDHFEGLFRRIVQEGIAKGEFAKVDVKLFVKMVLGAHNWVGVWFRPEGTLTGEEVADQMATWFLAALKPT
jgi:AcrR family transcriptional regulator